MTPAQPITAEGVRFIPRPCSCTWTLRLGGGEARWTLAEASPSCKIHGLAARASSKSGGAS